MKTSSSHQYGHLTPAQNDRIAHVREEVTKWIGQYPERKSAISAIALFGSRAVGLDDPELSDWDLLLVRNDDASPGHWPSDDLYIFEECPMEWHQRTVSGYLEELKSSSLSLSSAVERFGVPLFGRLPNTSEFDRSGHNLRMSIDELIGFLLGISSFGASLIAPIKTYLSQREAGYPFRTRDGQPYVPQLFKNSSNFAEHVSKLVVAFRDITPDTVHNLERVASQLPLDDPYRERITALNGATREGSIFLYARSSRDPDKLEDEPVQRSTARIVLSFRLLLDFLQDHGSEMEKRSTEQETADLLKWYVTSWRSEVANELSSLASENPNETWIEAIRHDSDGIARHLDDLYLSLGRA